MSKMPTNKLVTIGLIVMTVVAVGGIAGAGMLWLNCNSLESQIRSLVGDYESLQDDCDAIQALYDALFGDYTILTGDYDDLLAVYADLLDDFNALNATYYSLLADYLSLNTTYYTLLDSYNNLVLDYNALMALYNSLLANYNTLVAAYDALVINYDNLVIAYNTLEAAYLQICEWISQQILPAQHSNWAEAVRRYYMDLYLGGLSDKAYWKQFANYSRYVILHDANQYNAFTDVSNAFSDALRFGSNTMFLAHNTFYNTFYPWCPWYGGWYPFPTEIVGIDTIHQWVVDNIDYEYDSAITVMQESFAWDYIKFPVETAFRTLGDCEDQAILDACLLESCGYECAVVIMHDPAHPTYGAFYHGVLSVHIEDTAAFFAAYPAGHLWRMGTSDPYYPDYTWCFLDPTWDTPFGTDPAWIIDYLSTGISWSVHSTAVCDIGGIIL